MGDLETVSDVVQEIELIRVVEEPNEMYSNWIGDFWVCTHADQESAVSCAQRIVEAILACGWRKSG